MKALIAFIVMALLILTLIEINERRKKRKSNSPQDGPTATQPDRETVCETACSDCSLLDVCEKEEKKAKFHLPF